MTGQKRLPYGSLFCLFRCRETRQKSAGAPEHFQIAERPFRNHRIHFRSLAEWDCESRESRHIHERYRPPERRIHHRNELVCDAVESFFGAPKLPIEALGLSFPNPIGLAAGMDKHAEALPAWAALGEDFSSVDSDAQVLRGKHVMVAKVGYNIHQITHPDGSVVNEFVSPAGVVFGVSWQGHFMPNLQQLLGSYMTNFREGQRTHVLPRRAVTVKGDNFVLSSMGHMLNFRGRAYVPGLIPANLTAEVVQ